MLWKHLPSDFIQYSHVAISTQNCKYIWVKLCDWRSRKIPRQELNLVPSKIGYSFESHFWADHSNCWGMPSLTDVNRIMKWTLENSLVAHLKLWNRSLMHFFLSLMHSAFIDDTVSSLKEIPMLTFGKLICKWSHIRGVGSSKT
jgi:hypothetical protein